MVSIIYGLININGLNNICGLININGLNNIYCLININGIINIDEIILFIYLWDY